MKRKRKRSALERREMEAAIILADLNGKSFKGVCWHKACRKFEVKIKHQSKSHHLGYWADSVHAAEIYDIACIHLRAFKAKTNFPYFFDGKHVIYYGSRYCSWWRLRPYMWRITEVK